MILTISIFRAILFLLVIILTLKYSYAVIDLSDCTLAKNNGVDYCIMGMAVDFNQDDLNYIKQYYQNQNCITIANSDYPQYYLSGSSCLSNNDMIFYLQNSSNMQKVYFKIYLVIKYKPDPNLVSTLSINGQSREYQGFKAHYQNDYSYNILENTVIANSKEITIKVSATSQFYSYQTYINQISLACQPNCLKCDENGYQICQQCYDGFYYLQSSNQCLQCDSKCQTCDGSTSSNCLSCFSGTYYQQSMRTCVNSCNQDQFQNAQLWKCQSCDSSCASCNGPSQFNCLSCFSGNYYNQTTKQCLQCDSSCKTCDGAGQSNCLSCNPGSYYQQSSNMCVKSCNLNQFPDSNVWKCQLCDNSCASCDGPSQINCKSCKINSFLYNKSCINPCPNGFQSNSISLTCDSCQNYWTSQCNPCLPSCQLCNQQQIQNNQCQTCYSETRQLDSKNKCSCLNKNDQRDIFYQCSYQNIAVIDARLSSTSPLLTIDLGSPLLNIISNGPQQLCSQIFDPTTLNNLGGQDTQCQISGNTILVNLSDSSKIMENNQITLLPNKLKFIDYSSTFINIFYRNIVFQDPPGETLLQFSYNHIENSCNPINITLYNIQNDAGRKFMSLNWTLVQIAGSISNQQQENIIEILSQASQNMNTSLIIDQKYIPSNINITIQFSSQLKVNQNSTQTFTIIYQKQKFIRVSYLQSIYPPIYKYMSMSFQFQFYVEICELGQITYYKEPVDLQLISNQLQQVSISQYNLSSFQYDILPYSLASNQAFNMSVIF